MAHIGAVSLARRLKSAPLFAALPAASAQLTTPTAHLRPTRLYSTRAPKPKLAFALDIDGVLKQGPNVLPAALRAFDIINGDNPVSTRIPYLLLTNGGGWSESERALRLSKDFGFDIPETQIIQAHTVMRSLTRLYAGRPILCLGGPETPPGRARSVMNGYGFRDVYTAHDLIASAPAAWPFSTISDAHRAEARKADFSKVNFAAVMVFHDSRDFGRDIQFIVDILRSRDGVFGTIDDERRAGQSKAQIPLYFSHGDLLWGNDFPVVRYGQGAFRVACEAIYEATTGRKLEYTVFGKPERLIYEYAEAVLREQIDPADVDREWTAEERANVWMIGDNPAADIKGANDWGFSSALVRTGVYRDVEGPPAHRPTVLVDDVEQAVKAAMKKVWGC
ncbi:unnamed protein product [Tilletia controversa]|nr:unnamed protein product [Tilletia controversa]CAD6979218.1 unnamed protein product [Tilletia controversa]